MKRIVTALLLALNMFAFALAGPAQAQQAGQETVWIQIAARPSLADAQQEAQSYAARLPDVAGFTLGAGWYGIVLGPYTRQDAERVLQVYRSEGQIPRDSFIAFQANLRNQFYPVGAQDQATATAPTTAPAVPQVSEPVVESQPQITLPDETPAEARRSERLLTREEREELQIALKAAGFYAAAIDGAFGRGTRRSMSDWQSFKGFEPTGVLTTAQRQVLLDDYNAPLISVGMANVIDTGAGISMDIPAGEVAFSGYESPFAHYDSRGSLGVRVLMISQRGDKNTLFGLYDIMQTLEIVPLDGPRQRGNDSFTIEGSNGQIVSHTEARLQNGEIKGFTLIWPTGDEDRRARVLAAMQNSFQRLDGVLDAAAGSDVRQSVDLVSGLEVRKPRLSRTGFFVDQNGAVVTTSDVVAGCSRITLDHGYQATVAANNAEDGLAILQPVQNLAPMAVAGFTTQTPRLQSEIAVSGFSYEGILGAPSLTFGTLADIKSLDGNNGVIRLDLAAQPGDAGGPVLDASGAVLGMLLPREIKGRQLPEGVSFGINATALRNAITAAGIASADQSVGAAPLSNEALVRHASGMTVLVSCWE
ncbi:trypsin-like peptidase domain-containing protein [Phaeobacter gallaeciensis]|uniref:trypsin-like peptidase domain-containing protein n=1 Tax=Phaeobacter gallaeciensis TaxID=60890 RepID=UPI00237F0B13|nr:trypsin-like peptidase domain-containing protein [Phaeobacter gallaeciensis]MDE4190717.1 peptidoglycan-binding protein [Phaeobacter gallaeciensis]MDE4197790.1 peptidoglycan-binding protein [Phaeobacter gallaeciensis]MDE4201932.1 peptidoglycan-binding protein [Phaeobacter gallaeciensis]MDE4206768.1 peptidoglycan-binding protein [Phaeobacter gallaeciensis]MDE4215136.1 peptidoglycan-binding protein [Phaeobacter gallaeciensis]